MNDPDVQPNHGWRHLFKTRCRAAQIESDVADAIQRLAARTQGQAYGEWEVPTLAKAIEKFPRYVA